MIPKKRLLYVLGCMIIIPLIANITVKAIPSGEIEVLPSINVKFPTPVYFSVKTIGDKPIGYEPILFLVMTEESYEALSEGVDIKWVDGEVTFPKEAFKIENDNSVLLPPEAESGYKYYVDMLKEQLDTNGSVYWTTGKALGDLVNRTPKEFIVTIHSTKPNMIVYVFGKSSPELEEYDMRSMILPSINNQIPQYPSETPPSEETPPPDEMPKFHVPEPTTVIGIFASITALLGYAAKKRIF